MSAQVLLQKEDSKVYCLQDSVPEIYCIDSQKPYTKAIIIISPGLCTRELHLIEPFIGFQLAQLGYKVYSINTLDLEKYDLNPNDPFHRISLTQKAYKRISSINPHQKFISYGHSLGCIDLLRVKPENIEACIYASPGFKGDKGKFSLLSFFKFFKAFLLGSNFELFSNVMKARPELNAYRNDSINAQFIWKLQEYAHGLENTHLWPENVPLLTWLGSKHDSDGIMEMKQPRKWIKNISKINHNCRIIEKMDSGHEPGWKNIEDSIELANDIDNWLEEHIL
ncbi:MAG: hypothetical protein QNJ31_07535 [Candidatus Caenarcaniphilales bacterium]|nr:hypothetical protein [Candidatus Caenarcaniphilales bacterium]